MCNLGNFQVFEDFKLICSTACEISIAACDREVDNIKEEYASHIFGKICTNAIAIQRLFPENKILVGNKPVEIWDLSSICALARSLLEAYIIYYYLMIDDIDDDEFRFRIILWKLNAECDRLKVLNWIRSKSPEVASVKKKIRQLKREIEGSEFYQNLDMDKKTSCLSGEIAIFLQQHEIVKSAGLNQCLFNAIYKHLSNYSHTNPLSIEMIKMFHAGNLQAKNDFKLAIKYSIYFLGLAVLDFVKLFPDQEYKINKSRIRILLNECECLKIPFNNTQ